MKKITLYMTGSLMAALLLTACGGEEKSESGLTAEAEERGGEEVIRTQ